MHTQTKYDWDGMQQVPQEFLGVKLVKTGIAWPYFSEQMGFTWGRIVAEREFGNVKIMKFITYGRKFDLRSNTNIDGGTFEYSIWVDRKETSNCANSWESALLHAWGLQKEGPMSKFAIYAEKLLK